MVISVVYANKGNSKMFHICLVKSSSAEIFVFDTECCYCVLVPSQSQKGTPLLTLMKDPYILIAAGKKIKAVDVRKSMSVGYCPLLWR